MLQGVALRSGARARKWSCAPPAGGAAALLGLHLAGRCMKPLSSPNTCNPGRYEQTAIGQKYRDQCMPALRAAWMRTAQWHPVNTNDRADTAIHTAPQVSIVKLRIGPPLDAEKARSEDRALPEDDAP